MITRTRLVIIVLGLLFAMPAIPFKLPFINVTAVVIGGLLGLAASAGLAMVVSKVPHLQNNLVMYSGSNYDRDGLFVTLCSPKLNRWFWLVGVVVGTSAGVHLSALYNYFILFELEVALCLGVYTVCCFGAFVAYVLTDNMQSFRAEAFDLFQGGEVTWTLNNLLMSLAAGIGFGEFGGTLCGSYGVGFMIGYYCLYQVALYIGLWTAGMLVGGLCVVSSLVSCAARWYMKSVYAKLPEESQLD